MNTILVPTERHCSCCCHFYFLISSSTCTYRYLHILCIILLREHKNSNSHTPQQIDALSPTSVGDFTKTCSTECFTRKKYYCLVQQDQSNHNTQTLHNRHKNTKKIVLFTNSHI